MTSPSPESLGLCSERLARAEARMGKFIADGILPGAITLVSRHGKTAHLRVQGFQNLERQEPLREDSIFRIYSMTKIINAVAVLRLYERGELDLHDRISRYLPAFGELKVQEEDGRLVDPLRPVTVYELLRYCGGLAPSISPEEQETADYDLAAYVDRLAARPLMAQPGTRWIYGHSNDVLARVVEVVSGLSYPAFLRREILDPLDMRDTGFYVTEAQAPRLSTLYRYQKEGQLRVMDDNQPGSPYLRDRPLQGGSSGMVSTLRDYQRFAEMLLGRGEREGVRLLGRKTVDLMTLDHLPPEIPSIEVGTQCFRFGLGVSVLTDVARSRCLSSRGEFGWGGAAGTQVWINPEEDMVVMIMIQVRAEVPTGIMDVYKRLVYQALI